MIIKRSADNPVLKSNKDQSWEAGAVFNGCPVKQDGKIYLVYRAMSLRHYHTLAQTKIMVSDIGIAQSKDGIHFENRKRFIVPEKPWERFGCEDPRVTKLGDKYYIFYTALSTYPFRPEGIKIGLAISKDLKTVEEKYLITPFNAKGMALFPERINGKIWSLFTVHTDQPPAEICLASFDKEADLWSPEYWQKWYQNYMKYSLSLKRSSQDHIEVGAPPIKTQHGWLVIYSYIRNYFSPKRSFTIEVVLLDLNNPLKIIARTQAPILTAEESYERIGLVPDVVFPSGAILKDDWLYLYYGAADTTCCLAFIKLSSLLGQMIGREERTVRLIRAKENPIIKPIKVHPWESKATFNPAVLYLREKFHIIYRAMSQDNTSVFGYAESQNGIRIDNRLPQPIYTPREPFEQKIQPGANSGCEDPRLTQIDNKIYICYTAFDSKNPPRVALTWITIEDFLNQKWHWSKPVLISPPNIDDKDAFIFPEKVNGKYMIVHRSGLDIDLSFSSTLDYKDNTWLEEQRWIAPRKWWWDSKKVGAAAPPIKTEDGWVMFYHGISEDQIYRLGAVLLDLKNPTKIISRTDNPIFEPETIYEKTGQIPNVVFPCGTVLTGEKVFIYYGAADQVVGVATVKLQDLIKVLKLM